MLQIGIIGCILYVIGDFLFAATGKNQSAETIGLMVRVAYLEMGTWRMVASILCGFIGTLLYYMGFHQMYQLLCIRIDGFRNEWLLKLFRAAYVTGTVAWAYVHAMFMNVALIFKFIFQAYGDQDKAADIANRVFYCNAAPMLAAFILCDGILTVAVISMIWKNIIPLKSIVLKVLATVCNPLLFAGIIGNLTTLLPWPFNQIDHGTESFGHALVLVLGIVLLHSLEREGKIVDYA